MTGISPISRNSTYKFPRECPTKTDWVEWTYAWKMLLGRFNLLQHPLGDRINDSNIIWPWLYDETTDTIVETSRDGVSTFFIRPQAGRTTCRGTCYIKSEGAVSIGDHPLRLASCTQVRPTRSSGLESRLSLMCTSTPVVQPLASSPSFWDALLVQGGEWMWTNFQFNWDDSFDWMMAAYQEGSLLWVTDGSYNSKTAPEVSGVGWIVHDGKSGRQWKCSFIEISPAANSYRAELLGLYAIHVFISTFIHHFSLHTPSKTKLRCDNKMALRCSSRPDTI